MSVVDNLNLINQYKGDIKQAIVDKGVDMTNTPLSGYASKIGEIQTGSDPVTEELTVTNNGTYTPGEGIDGYSKVTVEVPQEVEGYTLRNVLETGIQESYLYDVSVTSVRSYAMIYNSYIRTLNLPNCSYIDGNAFRGCINLQIVELPEVKKIGDSSLDGANTFNVCYSLQSVNIPNVSFIGSSAFKSCASLQSIYFPNLLYIGNEAFTQCSSLQSVNIPNVSYIGSSAFQSCTSLQSIYLPNVSYIGSNVFRNCFSIESVTVGTDLSYVATLNNVNAFINSPMSNSTYIGYYGSIYVPAALESEYKSATNWVAYSNRIVGI